MIDLVKPVDTLSRGWEERNCGAVPAKAEKKEAQEGRGSAGWEVSLLLWSQGPVPAATNVALKHITQPNRSRWGSLPGGLQWKMSGRGRACERRRESE